MCDSHIFLLDSAAVRCPRGKNLRKQPAFLDWGAMGGRGEFIITKTWGRVSMELKLRLLGRRSLLAAAGISVLGGGSLYARAQTFKKEA